MALDLSNLIVKSLIHERDSWEIAFAYYWVSTIRGTSIQLCAAFVTSHNLRDGVILEICNLRDCTVHTPPATWVVHAST